MDGLGIAMVVIFCVLTAGLGTLLGFYIRAIFLNASRQTPVQFTVKMPLWYIIFAFIGYVLALFVVVALTTFWTVDVHPATYVIFAVLSAVFALIMVIMMFIRIEVRGENITVFNLTGKHPYRLDSLTEKREINGSFGLAFYVKDKRVFKANAYCTGYEYLVKYTENVPLYEFKPRKEFHTIKRDNDEK